MRKNILCFHENDLYEQKKGNQYQTENMHMDCFSGPCTTAIKHPEQIFSCNESPFNEQTIGNKFQVASETKRILNCLYRGHDCA